MWPPVLLALMVLTALPGTLRAQDDDEPFLGGQQATGPGGANEAAAQAQEDKQDPAPFMPRGEAAEDIATDRRDFPTPKLSFNHRYKVLTGHNHTRGVFIFFTGKEELREGRLLNSYQQTIRIEESPTEYKFIKFSLDFTQNYDFESEQFFDSYFVFNEIYMNHTSGNHQLRWGNQAFRLGRVRLGSPVDVLHYENLVSYLTFDNESSKQSLPSVRYDYFGKDQRFTWYLSPIAKRTFGMRLTNFREDAAARDQGNEPEKRSLLRDYFGVQHEWLGSTTNLRLGFFHWFDNRPQVSVSYDPALGTGSFLDLVNTYREKESISNFATVEFDMTLGAVSWKLDLGLFERKNFYDYQVLPGGITTIGTVSVPHLSLATSLEKAFPSFYGMVVYTYENLRDVPAGTHVLFVENEAQPIGEERDLEKHGGSLLLRVPVVANHTATLTVNGVNPFKAAFAYLEWEWKRPEYHSAWDLKLLRFQTEKIKMTDEPIRSSQIYLTYTRNFSGN